MATNKVPNVLKSNYPYTGVKAACKSTVAKTKSYPVSINYMFATDKPHYYLSMLKDRPVNAWIRADTDIFKFYSGGIINNSCCLGSGLTLNHVVQIVGYTFDGKGLSAWIIRNSFGTTWGEAGYGRIKITPQGEGVCGELNTGYSVGMSPQ